VCVGKDFECVTGKNTKSADVVWNFARTVKVFVDTALNQGIRRNGHLPGGEKVAHRMEYVRVRSDFHGNIDSGITISGGQSAPDPVKRLLGDAEKSAEIVSADKIVS